MSALTLTHIGGPTALLEVEGWRVLTDPTFDAPGRTYRFGWGTSSRKTTGPAIPAAEIGPVDTVLYDGVRSVARRLAVGTAVLHLGKVGFPVTGPLAYTMGARDAVELVRLLQPASVVPVHYEGWSHFRQGRDDLVTALSGAPDVAERFRWARPGEPLTFTV